MPRSLRLVPSPDSVGLGTKLAHLVPGKPVKALATQRGIETVGDLLDFLPSQYVDTERGSDFSTLSPGRWAVVFGRVASANVVQNRTTRGKRFEVILRGAGPGEIHLTYFKPYQHPSKLVPGAEGMFAGRVSTFNGELQMAQPAYRLLGEGEGWGGLFPIYPYTKGVSPIQMVDLFEFVFAVLGDLPDPIPAEVLREQNLPSRRDAYQAIHLPDSWADRARALARLQWEEALIVQTAVAVRRHTAQAESTTARPARAGGLLEAFDERLPFELTAGQEGVSTEIFADLAREIPMHRLLQGEVGSGKTVVALRAMLATVDAGGQAALLAPTEVLATQHYRSLKGLLGDLATSGELGSHPDSTSVRLLTGGMPAAARRAASAEIADGRAGIVVGTHALLQDAVDFSDLGLVVVDEQHRFGVEQRDALRSKAIAPPHLLVMTATPIPRTVAMTFFGDMEVSVLRELPAGRAPIATHVVPTAKPAWVARTWARVAEEVKAGHQVYVVCPRIGEESDSGDTGGSAGRGKGMAGDEEAGYAGLVLVTDEEGGARDPGRGVHEVLAELRAHPGLLHVRVEMLHGRMTSDAKDATMADFAAGRIDVLVATTVIEVGVDVANATVMVVVDADRFGVSQLHQLRGRVGRGAAAGLCLLMTDAAEGLPRERLEAVASTTDGFALAEIDLEQRREGDVLGANQSGRSSLRRLRLSKDLDIITGARAIARELVAGDPELSRSPELRKAVDDLNAEHGEWLERS